MKFIIFVLVVAVAYVMVKAMRTPKRQVDLSGGMRNLPQSVVERIDEERDSWEGRFIGGAADPRPVTALLRISYADSNGLTTNRVIAVREFENAENDAGLIMARCELRQATRTFRYDRIQQCVDAETGEIISNVRAYLRDKYQASPDCSIDAFFDAHSTALECLMFIAKADGRVMAAERKEIIKFCLKHLPDTRVSEADIEKALKGTRNVSITSYRRNVAAICGAAEEFKADLIATAEKLIQTQKTIHPAEQDAVDYLRKHLAVA